MTSRTAYILTTNKSSVRTVFSQCVLEKIGFSVILVQHISHEDKVLSNKISMQHIYELIANGEEALEPYIFDYLLLCNKVCGASHYNMQMKIIVETELEFNKWIKSQQTFAQFVQ